MQSRFEIAISGSHCFSAEFTYAVLDSALRGRHERIQDVSITPNAAFVRCPTNCSWFYSVYWRESYWTRDAFETKVFDLRIFIAPDGDVRAKE